MKGVKIFLANGFEDIEALGTADVLRRGGVPVELFAIADEPFVSSSHGLTVGVEHFLSELDVNHSGTGAHDFLIFPGGMPGSKSLASCRKLISLMQAHYDAGGSLAAICAAPGLVLSQLKQTPEQFTCFDSFEDSLIAKGAEFRKAPAIRSGRIITGRSAGYAVEFGLEILSAIKGEQKAAEVRAAMLLDLDD